MDNKDEELVDSFRKAYEVTLKKHHGILVRPIFALAVKACPYRKDFYEKLGSNIDDVMVLLEDWLKALENLVGILVQFYLELGIEK